VGIASGTNSAVNGFLVLKLSLLHVGWYMQYVFIGLFKISSCNLDYATLYSEGAKKMYTHFKEGKNCINL
jgi:hypothetical protein